MNMRMQYNVPIILPEVDLFDLFFFCSCSRNRYIAYRQMVHWCWGYLGRNIRVPLPSCAITRIRQTFPGIDYTGFKLANM